MIVQTQKTRPFLRNSWHDSSDSEDSDVVENLILNCKLERNILVVEYKLHTRERLLYYYHGVENLQWENWLIDV